MEALWSLYAGRQTLFEDRVDAGARLAERLMQYRGKGALVLGIPRGGVPVAAEVARRLDADLDIVVARKVGAPNYPELAIGAVTASGAQCFNADTIRYLGVSDAYLKMAVTEEMAEARRREARFRGAEPARPIKDRIAIVVDDGLATGATMRAAVRAVRQQQPARLIVAVPVGSREACAALRDEVDELVCLHQPEPFHAVGAFYARFAPTEDAEVTRLLAEARARPAAPAPSHSESPE
ncbi:MAG TPA: phosphoribosyltransferase family protein [Chloroflexota bacterium]|nr:phosphoribosyltransferase family protein [Chloroflexota bacterium]